VLGISTLKEEKAEKTQKPAEKKAGQHEKSKEVEKTSGQ